MTEERTQLAAVPGLAKLPPPPARPAPAPLAALSVPPVEQRESAAVPRSSSRPLPRTPRSASKAADVHETSFTTTLVLRDLLRARMESTPATTLAEVVFGAIENHAEELTRLVAAEKPPKAAAGGGAGLFPHPVKASRPTAEPRVTVQLRAPAGNFTVLDRLVASTGADSRSQLITAALRAELD